MVLGCRFTTFDILTSERLVRVPQSSQMRFTIDTGVIELPGSLGRDKTVDSATLNLVASNLHPQNPVSVAITVADVTEPNVFRPVATFDLEPRETRELRVVQTRPDDGLVRATQSEGINIRFDSRSPAAGIGEIEFRFTVRVVAHKRTPGTGAGTLLFY